MKMSVSVFTRYLKILVWGGGTIRGKKDQRFMIKKENCAVRNPGAGLEITNLDQPTCHH